MAHFRAVPAALTGALVAVLVGCSSGGTGVSVTPPPPATTGGTPETATTKPVAAAPGTTTPGPSPSTTTTRTRPASLSIPSIGVEGLSVVPYKGTTDDWPGTRIQNRGVAASPYGNQGGVGPGETGNYLVTAHRLSAGGPLRNLPSVRNGDSVLVTSDGVTYTYVITDSRQTSFRSERSLAEQRAAVPGHPGKQPTQAMITISTCATPEDDAAGNFWRDDRGNPEHRIDKIGVLREVNPGSSSP
ncbi:class E sortase [Streptomyces sp. NPDC002187]|uniref:class E sortase n=1 Tax=Streptomyces sp. NPDC002187 TaxID=3364637 RepID=UPI0036C1A237